MTKSNRALARSGLVESGASPRCPACAGWLEFGTDRDGRAVQHCACGYRGYVPLRSGTPPGTPAEILAKPPDLQ